MASSRNGTGMKILWIPGRKRHDRKGIYTSTNKAIIIMILNLSEAKII